MKKLDPFKYDLFPRDDEDDEEDEDYFEMEIPKLPDEIQLPKMENENVRRPVDTWNPGRIPQLGNHVFSLVGSNSVIFGR